MANVSNNLYKQIEHLKKIIGNDLTIEDQLRYAALLDAINTMTPEVKSKWCDIIIADLKSYKIYNEMDEIANDIDIFFKNKPETEDITKRILELPKYRLLHFMSDDFIKKYNNYTDKVYEFYLYKNFIGDYSLMSLAEIREIVNTKSRKTVEELKESIVLPEPLGVVINKLEKDNSPYKYCNRELLKQLYAYKNGLILIPAIELEQKIKIAKGEVLAAKENLKKIKNKKRRVVTLVTAGFIGWNALIWTITKFAMKQPYHFVLTGTIYDTDMNELDHIESDHTSEDTIAKTLSSSDLNTEKTYITELSDTVDGVTHVKVYDYTGVDLNKDQLETMTLDESRLIIDEDTKGKGERFTYNYYGIGAGKAHRNISTIKYEFNTTASVVIFAMVALVLDIMYALSVALEISLEDMWIELKEKRELSNESIEKLEKLFIEYKKVLTQQGTTITTEEVDKSLEELRRMTQR